jgi:integrase
LKISEPKYEAGLERPAKWRVDVTFKGRRKKVYLKSRKDGRDYRSNLQDAFEKGRLTIDFPTISKALRYRDCGSNDVLWCEAEELFLDDGRKRNLRPASLDGIEGHLRRARERIGNQCLGDLEREHITDYICEIGGTEKSRAAIRGALVAFLSWSGDQGFCKRGKFKGLKWPKIRHDQSRPMFLSVEEVERLFAQANVYLPGGNGAHGRIDRKKTVRFRAALACALYLGIRPGSVVKGQARYGELPCLKGQDLRLEEATVVVPESISKTRRERRVSEVPKNVLSLLEAAKYRPNEYVLPFGFERYIYHLNRTRQAASVDRWCQKILRHTFATYGFWKGLEWVIEAGGWQDPRMLTKHYQGGCTRAESDAFYDLCLA